MIFNISKCLLYLPLIGFCAAILLQKRKSPKDVPLRICQLLILLIIVFLGSFVAIRLLEKWIDLKGVSNLVFMLRWNFHNIILFLVFMIFKIRNSRKNYQLLFGISVISGVFAVIQIAVCYFLFLSNLEGLTPVILGQISLCSMAILLIQGGILELMERSLRNQSKQNEEEKKLLSQKYEQDYCLLVEKQKAMVDGLREDMSNKIFQVQSIIEHPNQGQEEDIYKLLLDLNEKVDKTGRISFCKNAVLNIILALKYAQADKAGVGMDVRVDSYKETEAEDCDLCSIVTNLIDNAIEASKRVKESNNDVSPIYVRIGCRGGYLILKVKNTKLDSLKKNSKGQYISSKRDVNHSKECGRGIKIVENALEKYGGYLRFEEKDTQMTALAFIPLLEMNQKIEVDKNEKFS